MSFGDVGSHTHSLCVLVSFRLFESGEVTNLAGGRSLDGMCLHELWRARVLIVHACI